MECLRYEMAICGTLTSGNDSHICAFMALHETVRYGTSTQ